MNKFGVLKTKALQKLTEAYANGNKKEVKTILKLIKEDREFSSLYLFYEHVENKYIENKEDAKSFINSIVPLLVEKRRIIDTRPTSRMLNEAIGDINVSENPVYEDLDILAERDTLMNIDKKITAKLRLIEHLTTKKNTKETTGTPIIKNENLLHTILANNFNVLYDNTLNEEEKEELKKILAITDDEFQKNYETLRTEVIEKMNKIQSENPPDELNKRLNEARMEMSTMDRTKFNYYKLQQLKNGI